MTEFSDSNSVPSRFDGFSFFHSNHPEYIRSSELHKLALLTQQEIDKVIENGDQDEVAALQKNMVFILRELDEAAAEANLMGKAVKVQSIRVYRPTETFNHLGIPSHTVEEEKADEGDYFFDYPQLEGQFCGFFSVLTGELEDGNEGDTLYRINGFKLVYQVYMGHQESAHFSGMRFAYAHVDESSIVFLDDYSFDKNEVAATKLRRTIPYMNEEYNAITTDISFIESYLQDRENYDHEDFHHVAQRLYAIFNGTPEISLQAKDAILDIVKNRLLDKATVYRVKANFFIVKSPPDEENPSGKEIYMGKNGEAKEPIEMNARLLDLIIKPDDNGEKPYISVEVDTKAYLGTALISMSDIVEITPVN